MRNALLVSVMLVVAPCAAMADANLPWLNNAAPAPAATTQQSLPWQSQPAAAPAAAPVKKLDALPPSAYVKYEDAELRSKDDRKLNALATDYFDVAASSKGASARYATLLKRAQDLKKVLQGRSYDAKDLVADVTKLEGRIATAKKQADDNAAALAQSGDAAAAAKLKPAAKGTAKH